MVVFYYNDNVIQFLKLKYSGVFKKPLLVSFVTIHLYGVTALSVSTVVCEVLARNTVRPVLNRGAE